VNLKREAAKLMCQVAMQHYYHNCFWMSITPFLRFWTSYLTPLVKSGSPESFRYIAVRMCADVAGKVISAIPPSSTLAATFDGSCSLHKLHPIMLEGAQSISAAFTQIYVPTPSSNCAALPVARSWSGRLKLCTNT
jgi:hypothetical protein